MKTARKTWWMCFMFVALLFSIGESKKQELFDPEEQAVIRAFVTAIQTDNFEEVESLLHQSERKLLQGAKGNFPFAVIRRLKTFRLKHLLRDSEIRVENGKIIGIYRKFQIHGLTEMMKAVAKPEPEISAPAEEKDDDEEEQEDKKTRKAEQKRVNAVFKDFVAAIDAGKFKDAVDMIDPDELEIFFDSKGEVTPAITARLSKLDRKGANLLQLDKGKLENVHLLVPYDQNRLQKAVGRFVDAIHAGDWIRAMSMLTRYERKLLTDKQEKIKPEYKVRLANLKKEDYEVFYLFDDRLSGTLEWMGLGVYGEKTEGKK